MSDAIVSLSGGMDSVSVLGHAMEHKKKGRLDNIHCVGFCYGSKHNPYENRAAIEVCEFYDVPFRLIDLTKVMEGFRSALMPGGTVPEGFYEAENMRQTVVPGRNAIFISILAGLAQSMKCHSVFLGIHSGDHFIYPDCRPEFFYSMKAALKAAYGVSLEAPFLQGDKKSIIEFGRGIGVPYHLTRTCYKDQKVACGKCGSCQERLDAFAKVGIEDPIDYESRVLIPKSE